MITRKSQKVVEFGSFHLSWKPEISM